MTDSKNVKSKDIAQYLEETRGLERDYLTEIVRSRRNAWRLAIACALLTALSLVAILGLTPLKTSTPFILRVDNATGHIDQLTQMNHLETSYGEVVDAYFLNLYVLNRESYDYATIQTNYNITALLSSTEVQKEYYTLFDGPQSRDKMLSNHTKIFVQVRSITPDIKDQSAVVRFATHDEDANGSSSTPKYWVATIGYRYVEAAMSAADRRINPLGFQVTSYRIDPEVIETSP